MTMAIPAFASLDKRQQITVVVGIAAALVLLFGWLSWRALTKLGPDPALPAFLQRRGGEWAKIEELIVQIEAKDAIIRQEPDIRRQLAALATEIEVADQRLPKVAEKPEIRQLIEKLARDVPTSIGSVQFKGVRIIEGGPVKGQDYQPVTYQTEVAGALNGNIKNVD